MKPGRAPRPPINHRCKTPCLGCSPRNDQRAPEEEVAAVAPERPTAECVRRRQPLRRSAPHRRDVDEGSPWLALSRAREGPCSPAADELP